MGWLRDLSGCVSGFPSCDLPFKLFRRCFCTCFVCLFAFVACLFAHPACSAVCLSALLFGWPAVRVCLSVRPCVYLCDCLSNVSVRVFDRVFLYPAACASACVSVSPPLAAFVSCIIFVSICVLVSVLDCCLSSPMSNYISMFAYLAVSLSVCVLVSVPIVLRLASWLGAMLCADCGGRMGGGDVLTWLSRACTRCEL